MLSLLHRHILRETFVSTMLAMGLFVFVLLLGNALRDMLELVVAGKLDVFLFMKLVGLLVPYVVAYALPLAMLTGTLVAFGRMSSQQEVTAMKSAGLSLGQIASPVIFLSTLGVVLGLIINLHYAPQARVAYKTLIASAVKDNPLSFIEPRRFINEFPGAVIYAGERDGLNLSDIWFWKLDAEKQVELFIRGREGRVQFKEAENKLVLTLLDGSTEQRKSANLESYTEAGFNILDFGELSFEWELDSVFGSQVVRTTRVKDMTFAQMMRQRDALLLEEATSGTGLTKERLQIQFYVQKNCAFAFSIFSLSLFGIPLAIRVGRRESQTNLALALLIALCFYALMIAVSWMEHNVALRPDLLIWLPNILFQSLGLYLIVRSNRH
jgi:lipopolysaccharide export system permease protein